MYGIICLICARSVKEFMQQKEEKFYPPLKTQTKMKLLKDRPTDDVVTKSIEGGYSLASAMLFTKEQILLDPLFWSALGKSEKWPEYTQVLTYYDQNRLNRDCTHSHNELTWKYQRRLFLDHIDTGGTPDTFFTTLLSQRDAK